MTADKERKISRPRWWLNTYFIFGFLLLLIAVLGWIRGPAYILDPGQPFTSALPWYYFLAAAVFFVNGLVSHGATVRAYEKAVRDERDA